MTGTIVARNKDRIFNKLDTIDRTLRAIPRKNAPDRAGFPQ
ncbi:hypothetical protein [Gluconacetobacter tumulicola]|nr:hypothetical protein [Gluconacetobacter tumulicola]